MRIYKLWFMTLLLAVFMAGCGSSHNSNSPAGDTTAPTVSSTNPGDTTTGVATNQKLTVTFSEAMDPATCCRLLQQGVTLVPRCGCVSGTATFAPAGNRGTSTGYTATATTGFKGHGRQRVGCRQDMGFTTGATTDTTAPP
jgi:hypothetical protein